VYVYMCVYVCVCVCMCVCVCVSLRLCGSRGGHDSFMSEQDVESKGPRSN